MEVKKLKINQSLVIYLFCKFHESLGFQKILHLGLEFPNCVAEKDGKQVAVDLAAESRHLKNHLKVAEYLRCDNYEIVEREKEYAIFQHSSLGSDCPVMIMTYPKEKFAIERTGIDLQDAELYARKLDYCICWEATPSLGPGIGHVTIVELRSIPFATDFIQQQQLLQQ